MEVKYSLFYYVLFGFTEMCISKILGLFSFPICCILHCMGLILNIACKQQLHTQMNVIMQILYNGHHRLVPLNPQTHKKSWYKIELSNCIHQKISFKSITINDDLTLI